MDRPTPRVHSETWSAVGNVCDLTVRDLEAWLEESPVGVGDRIFKLIHRARKLGKEVSAWAANPPDDKRKREVYKEVFDVREEAVALANSYGKVL